MSLNTCFSHCLPMYVLTLEWLKGKLWVGWLNCQKYKLMFS